MSRQTAKTISSKPEKFIPKTHAEDASLNEASPDIKDRPLVFYWRKMTREDRYNISSLLESKRVDDEFSVKNLGTVARYVWDNCVVEVQNVLTDEGAFESLKGAEKNRFFNTNGNDSEIAEVIRHIQENSVFSDAEAKN